MPPSFLFVDSSSQRTLIVDSTRRLCKLSSIFSIISAPQCCNQAELGHLRSYFVFHLYPSPISTDPFKGRIAGKFILNTINMLTEKRIFVLDQTITSTWNFFLPQFQFFLFKQYFFFFEEFIYYKKSISMTLWWIYYSLFCRAPWVKRAQL